MNPKAIELYKNHKIDLYGEPLEIAVCAQHCNGGIQVDCNWETRIRGLYAAGEAAGTFGPYRPGGSALNSTQAGSLRAAEHIARKEKEGYKPFDFSFLQSEAEDFLNPILERMEAVQEEPWSREMSKIAAQIREKESLTKLRGQLQSSLEGPLPIWKLYRKTFKYRDAMITQAAMLSAMELAAENFGSRGSGLILEPQGEEVSVHLEKYRYQRERVYPAETVVVTGWEQGRADSEMESARPVPEGDHWFETVWNSYKKIN